MGRDDRAGSRRIAPGCDADLVVFDRKPANVRYTIRDGRVTYRA